MFSFSLSPPKRVIPHACSLLMALPSRDIDLFSVERIGPLQYSGLAQFDKQYHGLDDGDTANFDKLSNEKTTSVINTGILCFGQNGYIKTTRSGIAAQAGISKAAGISLFCTKEKS